MATIAICDVHGNSRGLAQLLRRLEPELGDDDDVVFLGDLVDRGPDSKGVLDLVVELRLARPGRVQVIQGNHEEWLLETWRDSTRHSWLLGMDGLATVRSYSSAAAEQLAARLRELGPRLVLEKPALPYESFFSLVPAAHAELLRERLAPWFRTDDVLCVHAGVAVEGDPLADLHALRWGDHAFPEEYAGAELVVYGHRGDAETGPDGRPRPRVGPRGTTFGIDSSPLGIVTAMRFPDRALFHGA